MPPEPYGSIQVGHRVVHCTGLGTLNLPLYLADAFEILINTCSVGNAYAPLQPRDIGAERIEEAGPATQRRAPLRRVPALSEEALEHDAWMRFGWQRVVGDHDRQF